MKISFFKRIFFSYVFIGTIFTFLIYSFSFDVIKDHYYSNLRVDLAEKAKRVMPKITQNISLKKYNDVQNFVSNLSQYLNYRFTVIRADGFVIADSEESPKKMANHSDRPEIIEAKKNQEGTSKRYSMTVEAEMIYVAREIRQNKKIIAYVRTSYWVKDLNSLVNDLRADFFTSVFYMLLVAALFSFIASRRISDPLNQLVDFSKRLAKENFKTRIWIRGNDEFTILGNQLNSMAVEIDGLFGKIRREREQLNAVIENIREGLLVIKRSGEFVLANNSFRQNIKTENLLKKYFWEFIPVPEIVGYVNSISDEEPFKRYEINFEDKIFRLSLSYLPVNDQIICIFYDITKNRELERTKKDFVSNVSHELRTPLTAIKGFLETLLDDEENEDKKHYLSIIDRNADRLIALVKDLSVLSNLEKEKARLDLEEIYVRDFFEHIQLALDSKIREKNIKLDFAYPSVEKFVADQFKFEQVFLNLVDNAAKYSEASEISISMIKKTKNFEFTVSDNGIGINENHLSRLFERFYVVDKARSRKLGGTGLGLSIVKHIINLHGGSIKIKSKLGEGTKFIFKIPIINKLPEV